ncbi:MAG: hypothetical protein IID48_22055, partial [Proteobacteria bacterium]|nr:hypothetical protein [Pseudomonadota bacterium]
MTLASPPRSGPRLGAIALILAWLVLFAVLAAAAGYMFMAPEERAGAPAPEAASPESPPPVETAGVETTGVETAGAEEPAPEATPETAPAPPEAPRTVEAPQTAEAEAPPAIP